MIVTTKSGAVYKIDTQAKTWERVSKTDKSGELRSEGGEYLDLMAVVVGLRMELVCPGRRDDSLRFIWTSDVVAVEETE